MHDGGMKTHRRKSTWVSLAILVVSLTACSATPQATYSTVEDLKEAFVKAGGECDEWDATHSVEGSAESGTCGTHTVLSTYVSQAATEDRIEETKSFLESVDGDWGSWLVGENWIIHGPDVHEIKEELGGTVVSIQN